MSSRSSLHRNIVFNLSGALIPLMVSLFVIPVYLGRIGQSRYGIISLVWLLFGYFGLFDLGLSQATTNLLARRSNQSAPRQREIFWTATIVNAGLGTVGALAFALFGKLILERFVSIPIDLRSELQTALPWVACLLPLSTTGAVFVGALEAHERFLQLNILQVIGATLGQLLPLAAVIHFDIRIETAIAATVIARLLTTLPIFLLAVRQCGWGFATAVSFNAAIELFRYGGWITVSNIVGPILASIDQFMIGAMAGVESVPRYSIPFSMATRILLLPSAMTRALFPQLTKLNVDEAKARAEALMIAVSLALVLICAPAIILSHLALSIWLGSDFSSNASAICRTLLFGVWINGVAYVPYTMLQSQGKPSITAKLHVYELLPFFGILWLSLNYFGVIGAAMAWSLRVFVDAVFLCRAARFSRATVKRLLPSLGILIIAFGVSIVVRDSTIGAIAGACTIFLATLLYGISSDRAFANLYHKLSRLRSARAT